MEPITIRELLAATGGVLLGDHTDEDTCFHSVETDSRSIRENGLFIPLVGERFDGHDYVEAALKSGASGCLTSRPLDTFLPDKFYVQVEDTQRALGDY